MPPKRASTTEGERGSAPLEFVGVGLVLLVPLVYLIIALGAIQHQSLGVEAAARHTARAISRAPDAASAAARADAVLTAIVREYGMDPDRVQITISCTPDATPCPAPGSRLQVRVTARVALPLLPAFLGLDEVTSVGVHSQAVQKLPRRWGEP